MRLLVTFVGCCLLALTFSTRAFADDGNDLLKLCASAEKIVDGTRLSDDLSADALQCMAFLNGMTGMNTMYQVTLTAPGPQPFFCFPNQGIKVAQSVRIVVKFLRDHPEQLNQHDIVLVIKALAEAFPCKK